MLIKHNVYRLADGMPKMTVGVSTWLRGFWLAIRVVALAGAIICVLGGCAGARVKVNSICFTLRASENLNLDVHNRPSPIVLRFYELTTRVEFDRATFFELYDHDIDALGKTMLMRTEIVVRPGDVLAFTRAVNPETRTVAIVAAYQDIDDAHWRAVADAPSPQVSVLSARLGPSAVEFVDTSVTKSGGSTGSVSGYQSSQCCTPACVR